MAFFLINHLLSSVVLGLNSLLLHFEGQIDGIRIFFVNQVSISLIEFVRGVIGISLKVLLA